ncbi:MAG: DnaJ domain-containing protein [Myxococcota bacterium]|nr:DnaJ domain-containing protein [Myxococcota bacterium]
MGEIPENGRLDEWPFPRLLLEIHKHRFDGALTLSRERIGKRFLFQQGLPVYAESNLASESLGVQLMDAGRLTRADYNRVAAYIAKHDCKEGKALLQLGLLDPRGLFDALKDQVRIRMVECFGWPQGEFYVDAESAPSEEAAPFKTDPLAILQAGIETHWGNDRIFADLAPHMEHYALRTKRFAGTVARLERDAAVDAVVEALDGTRTLWKVVQMASSPRALAAAWVLDAAGALHYSDAAQSSELPELQPEVERELEIVVEGRADTATGSAAAAGSRKGRAGARPAAGAGKRDEARVEALRTEILEKHENLRELDAYQLLGVGRDADARAIKRAYLQAAKTYHPDALARLGLDEEVRECANKVFAEIGKAHNVLGDVKRRREYDASLANDAADLDADRVARAEMNYRKAEILIRQGNFNGALDFLRPAVELWPEECAYQSALGWALFKKRPSDPIAAREYLEKASVLDPKDASNLFRLSLVLRELGEVDAADDAARRAEELEPGVGG